VMCANEYPRRTWILLFPTTQFICFQRRSQFSLYTTGAIQWSKGRQIKSFWAVCDKLIYVLHCILMSCSIPMTSHSLLLASQLVLASMQACIVGSHCPRTMGNTCVMTLQCSSWHLMKSLQSSLHISISKGKPASFWSGGNSGLIRGVSSMFIIAVRNSPAPGMVHATCSAMS